MLLCLCAACFEVARHCAAPRGPVTCPAAWLRPCSQHHVEVENIITEPSGNSQIFILYGRRNDKGVLMQVLGDQSRPWAITRVPPLMITRLPSAPRSLFTAAAGPSTPGP